MVVTKLDAAGVGQVAIARFVGHKVGTLAGDTCSEDGSKANSLETSKRLRYGKKAVAAVRAVVARPVQFGFDLRLQSRRNFASHGSHYGWLRIGRHITSKSQEASDLNHQLSVHLLGVSRR